MNYIISCPIKFKTCCYFSSSFSLLKLQESWIGKISFNYLKNNQQETYCVKNFAFKHYSSSVGNNSLKLKNVPITPHQPKLPFKKWPVEEFGYYLAGLIEGDGHFSKRLEIIFHQKDLVFINIIRTKIGYGNIYKINDKKAYKLSIGSYSGLKKIFSLTNGKFVANHKILQFNRLLYDFKLIGPSYTVDLSNSWLIGFIAAEGCLQLDIADSKTHISGKSCKIRLQITQKDGLLLDLVKTALIKFGIPENKIIIRFDGRVHRLKITDRHLAIRIIIAYLDKYPMLSAKQLQYYYWRKAYLFLENNQHLSMEGLAKFKKLKAKLSNVYK